ncbi:hypothetical protein C1646_774296 [Rhizophagus diaphanus]|nr:hypothetical protein C1646_774296 [Rhizophagus diaphanus] [Rhizophagus sp. MUCL 43196]
MWLYSVQIQYNSEFVQNLYNIIFCTNSRFSIFYWDNGVKEKYGLIINYGSEIISEIYLGGADEVVRNSRLSVPDIATGKLMEYGSGEFHAPNLLFYTFVDSFNFALIDEGFGYQTTTKLNSIVFKECNYNNAIGNMCIVSLNNTITTNKNQSRTEVNYYQLEFLSTGSFVQFNMISKEISNTSDIFHLSSLIYRGLLVEKYYTNTTAIDFYILDNNGNYKSKGSFGPEFVNYNVFTRNATLLGIKKQTGDQYNNPVVELSTANISIFQLVNDDPYKPSLLWQTISGDSKLCTIGKPFKSRQHSVSITGLLRLNEEGSSKFLQTNQSEFFNNIITAFSKIIPVDEQRITTNGKWQNDPTSPKKVLLSFTINEAKSAIKPSSQTIFDNLSTLVKRKGFTALSNNEYTSLIDESASLTITQDYFGKFLPVIIIFSASLIILLILYFLARWINPEGNNSAIFETALIMQDFVMDLIFTLLRVNNTPHLIIPNMVFLIIPHIINFSLTISIVLSETATNPTFYTWFSDLPTLLLSICTIFSTIDILVINTLTSNLFGLKVFSPIITKIKEDYTLGVVTYDLIPSLVIISDGLVILNKLILRSYHALIRWYHRRDKIRELIRIRHLSAGSLRSIRTNV